MLSNERIVLGVCRDSVVGLDGCSRYFGGCRIPLPDPEIVPVPECEWMLVLGGGEQCQTHWHAAFQSLWLKSDRSCGAKSAEIGGFSTDRIPLHALTIGVPEAQNHWYRRSLQL